MLEINHEKQNKQLVSPLSPNFDQKNVKIIKSEIEQNRIVSYKFLAYVIQYIFFLTKISERSIFYSD